MARIVIEIIFNFWENLPNEKKLLSDRIVLC